MEATKRAAWGAQQAEMQAQHATNLAQRQTNQELHQANQAASDALKVQRQAMMDQRCQNIQQKMDARVSGFDSNNGKRMAVYTNMQDRISKFITRLSGEGYDTSKVQADLVILGQKIKQFETDKQAQMAKLDETKTFTCGHSNGEFMGKLGEARSTLMTVHKDAMDIRQFMLTTVRPDIMAIRKLKMDSKSSTTPNLSTETPKPEIQP
jgi:hypothetical protein